MATITTTERGTTTIVHDNGVTTVRYGAPGVPASVMQQIAANVAEHDQWVREEHTDPVTMTDTVQVLDDDDHVISVPREYVEVGTFRACTECGVYAAEGINGQENCHGFHCDLHTYQCCAAC